MTAVQESTEFFDKNEKRSASYDLKSQFLIYFQEFCMTQFILRGKNVECCSIMLFVFCLSGFRLLIRRFLPVRLPDKVVIFEAGVNCGIMKQ